MKFLVMVKATPGSETGQPPDAKMLAEMGRFNEELVKAGVMLAAEGLHPSSRGARVLFGPDGKRTVVDGPFTESKELIAGFWIIQAKDKEEAVAWMKRCPHPMPGAETHIEIRPIFELEDFGDALTPELREQEAKLRAQLTGG